MCIRDSALFGLVIGALAKFIMPGRDPGGVIVTAIIGMVGSMLGAFLGRAMGMYTYNTQAAGCVAFAQPVFQRFFIRDGPLLG